jgi:hypothetical protein
MSPPPTKPYTRYLHKVVGYKLEGDSDEVSDVRVQGTWLDLQDILIIL